MSKLLLSVCFCALTVLPGKSAVIATNFTGGPYTGATTLGDALNIGSSRDYKAFGLTIGTSPLNFVSMETIFDNNAILFSRIVSGGIYSDNAGNPGTQLVAFNDVTLPANANNVLVTTVANFTLLANTTYWFVLTGPVNIGLLPDWQRDTANTAPTGSSLASVVGYRLSQNNRTTWTTSTVNNQVQINADTPEPATLGLVTLTLLAGCLWRKRT